MIKRIILSLTACLMLAPSLVLADNVFFKDVPENHWARQAIERLKSLDVIHGYSDGSFRPDEAVTRAEVASMISNEHILMINQLNKVQSESQSAMNSVAKTLPSVVVVKGSSGEGGGFWISSKQILTAKHVIGSDKEVTIRLLSGQTFTGKAVKTSSKDLALIEVEPSMEVKPVNWAQTYQPGQTVLAIGHPNGMEYSISRGIISYKDRLPKGETQLYTQFDAVNNPGNSGGPLIDLNGNVVGLVDARITNPDSMGFGLAVRLEDIKEFLGL